MIHECDTIERSGIDWGQVKPARIMICIPTLSGKIGYALVDFIALCLRTSYTDGPFKFDFRIIPEIWPHYYARNLAVREFLRSDCDKLWFIDDDMLPTRDSFGMLLHDADIVSGIYYNLKHSNDGLGYEVFPVMYQRTADGKSFVHDYPTSKDQFIHPIAGAGGGCLLIKRHVLEDRRMWLPTQYVDAHGETQEYLSEEQGDPRWAPPLFRHLWKPGGNQLRSEDLDFCDRASKCGYSILGDHNSHFGHLKTFDVNRIVQTLALAQKTALAQAAKREAACEQ